ncbi:PfkB family carbohydrate kinase [Mucilaginibacter sp.]|uniref:PfkB family carbohydrate kinase n=1 Tax=Mucilaginibacter sp. TaxID=1882438 RepID=UPI0028457BE6|nr:PfkB family carbohydrate kinase [Mucilaginibacter sp.]MDR3695790.1 PfkB family carbohydrate kinase [Mucilaginibacter sp.]
MYDICCVGHITSDKVVNSRSVMFMPGGTAYYFSCALSKFDVNYLLVTALAPAEMRYVDELNAKGVEIKVQSSAHTVAFENIYAENQDERTQRVTQKADPFTMAQLAGADAKIFHLGPLLADDISLELIRELAKKGKISLDVQGYLREVVDFKVHAAGWPQKVAALQYIDILKADVAELKALTGCATVEEGAEMVAGWGVKEVIVTNGSSGSVIFSAGMFYTIPAYQPETIIDATGCGDTYMAGYLYQRNKGAGIQQSGEFAAAMAGLKTAGAGAFVGTEEDVVGFWKSFNE